MGAAIDRGVGKNDDLDLVRPITDRSGGLDENSSGKTFDGSAHIGACMGVCLARGANSLCASLRHCSARPIFGPCLLREKGFGFSQDAESRRQRFLRRNESGSARAECFGSVFIGPRGAGLVLDGSNVVSDLGARFRGDSRSTPCGLGIPAQSVAWGRASEHRSAGRRLSLPVDLRADAGRLFDGFHS
jgi:hypothetical protein